MAIDVRNFFKFLTAMTVQKNLPTENIFFKIYFNLDCEIIITHYLWNLYLNWHDNIATKCA